MNKRVLQQEEQRKNTTTENIEKYVKTLKKMIDCKTVYDEAHSNQAEYERFYNILEESFPLLHKRAEKLVFGSGCFVYAITDTTKEKPSINVMLMSHHDVVDNADKWDSNPFEAVNKDGSLWGRGTIDTKTPLFAQLQACEELLEEGYTFDGINLYIGLSLIHI